MAEAAVLKRVYIGGFAHSVTADEVSGRFKPFGQVQAVDIPAVPSGNETRGFGYVSISITPAQWSRCVRAYTGAKWKGGQLRVEEAKEDYMTRLRREWSEALEPAKPVDPEGDKAQRRGKRASNWQLAEDMALVTAKNLDRYEGWTKNRYGRPVLKHKMIKPNGRRLTYDPAKHKYSVDRVFASTDAKPSPALQWEYDAEEARSEFKRARKLPAETRKQIEHVEARLAKKRQIDEQAERAQKRLMLLENQITKQLESESEDDDGLESDSGSEILDVDTAEILAQQNLDGGAAPFENAEEIAALVASASAKVDPALRAKLESGLFDSSSEDESECDDGDETQAQRRVESAGPQAYKSMNAEERKLAMERKRAAAIARQFLGDDDNAAYGEAAAVLDFESEDIEDAGPQDGDGKNSKQPAKKASSSDSDTSSSSDSSSDNFDSDSDHSTDSGSSDDSSDSGGSSGDGNGSNGDGGNDDSDSSSDSSSDSDESDLEDESDSKDESDSEDAKRAQDNDSDAMDVDEPPASELKSLFGESKAKPSGGGLFGGPAAGDFKFTQMLGLEADEPSATAHMETDDHMRPVTGGARIAGPAERNLNANRLPMFFADTDSPMFKRPEPAFQRQKTEEELEAELEETRKDKIKEYKVLQRSALRKTRRLYESRSKSTNS
ncbi:hypothetical protein H4R23_003877 [Coemansia sp. Cherry 401B]|nr:hypothetical protein IWW54_004247 [Coemansia sp. RSA 2705]KAJ2727480.1 hypothetical protein H4R23_003877 [Coemansia sp. Cherry 401B]